jgi:hypothetical protein
LGGFSSEAAWAANTVGSSVGLTVAHPFVSRAFVYSSFGSSSASALQTVDSLYPFRTLGTGFRAGDLNGDGKTDLVLGENAYGAATAGAAEVRGSVWVLYNSGSAAQPFDSTVGSGAHQTRQFGTRTLGWSVAVGDFNGDTRLDFAAGDPGLTGEPGEVVLFY